MPFPASLTLITVEVRSDLLPGGGSTGWARLRYDLQPLTGAAADSIVAYVDEREDFAADGTCTLQVPATNATGWTPQDFAYEVTVCSGSRVRRGTVQLDKGTTTVNLADVVQWEGAAEQGVTYATVAQLAGKADVGHTHTASEVTDLASTVDLRIERLLRVVDAGEYVIRRGDVTTESPAVSGNLYVTHFTAAVTETIQTIRTGVGSGAATSATHAWIGILSWDGVNYTPVAESVDDPTRWASAFATYDTQIYEAGHAGVGGFEGWAKTAGTDYALWVLWIGSGSAPNLFAGGGGYQDSLEEPRSNAYIGSQTQPPAAPISGAFFGSDSRRFQGLMKR